MLNLSLFDAPLSAGETAALAEQEAIIERGLTTFVEVGAALLHIRDNRLYRGEFHRFEDYCLARWGMTKTHANRLIDATEVMGNLTPIGVIPATESQARILAPLTPDEQRAVWQEAVDTAPNGHVTAAHVASIVYARGVRPHVVNNSGNNEWYTPREYIDAARAVMGGIDLDPASSVEANAVVGAASYYTAEHDGLAQAWRGRVWMNPPYAGELVGQFTSRLGTYYATGDVTEAICLVNNATETAWFGTLITHAAAVVFPTRRVRFWLPGGELGGGPLQGQAVVYLGLNVAGFQAEFGRFGWAAIVA
jgi:hypothetical protein